MLQSYRNSTASVVYPRPRCLPACKQAYVQKHTLAGTMVKKKLHYLSAALIIAMLIFLITDLDLIAPPKMESGNENLRIDVSHIHNLASSSVQFPQAVREVMATMSYNPLKQKDNTFQGEDIRTTSFNKTLFQGEDRKDLLYTSGEAQLITHSKG